MSRSSASVMDICTLLGLLRARIWVRSSAGRVVKDAITSSSDSSDSLSVLLRLNGVQTV